MNSHLITFYTKPIARSTKWAKPRLHNLNFKLGENKTIPINLCTNKFTWNDHNIEPACDSLFSRIVNLNSFLIIHGLPNPNGISIVDNEFSILMIYDILRCKLVSAIEFNKKINKFVEK